MAPKTVLIADDDRDLVRILSMRCRQLGARVIAAYDAMTALTLVHQERPDAIILDIKMPAGSGLSVCEMLAADGRFASIPVLVLTGRADEETIRRCQAMHAHYVFKSGDVWERVAPILARLLDVTPAQTESLREAASPAIRAPRETGLPIAVAEPGYSGDGKAEGPPRARKRPTVLYVEDDAQVSDGLKLLLESKGLQVLQAFSGREGYRMAVSQQPDVILLDFVMPDGEGDYVLRRCQETMVTSAIPVIIVTGHGDRGMERKLRSQGAVGYITKPIDFDRLLEELGRYVSFAMSETAGGDA
jgi:CheY-like chemotaxis protein